MILAPLLLLVVPATPASADDNPLICVDPGPTHVYQYTVDVPEVCLL